MSAIRFCEGCVSQPNFLGYVILAVAAGFAAIMLLRPDRNSFHSIVNGERPVTLLVIISFVLAGILLSINLIAAESQWATDLLKILIGFLTGFIGASAASGRADAIRHQSPDQNIGGNSGIISGRDSFVQTTNASHIANYVQNTAHTRVSHQNIAQYVEASRGKATRGTLHGPLIHRFTIDISRLEISRTSIGRDQGPPTFAIMIAAISGEDGALIRTFIDNVHRDEGEILSVRLDREVDPDDSRIDVVVEYAFRL